jgi:serine/threonine protein kinase
MKEENPMSCSLADVKSVFGKALEFDSSTQRAAYLDQACGSDTRLRGEVDSLLQAHEAAGPFLGDTHEADVKGGFAPATEVSAGTMLGRYKLLEPIGEGGMGAVWMAKQIEPVKRLVAVKLIKPGMDSKSVVARFEAERQALALMDHENIARVLDAGTTESGRLYFAMDLVKGVPITRYCDEHRLTPRQRLELFIPVCRAIQHAHQKGIIHRDIKPSNVLVALYDGKAVPKVIDFGVAKATGQSLTDETLVTGFGNIVGTAEYMSPEQAEFNQLDIDTRSDIYSLGVLLFELLTGSPPFTMKEMERPNALELLRAIREEEPTKPSRKLSTSESLPALAASRGMEPARLARLVRGELDWIVLKALEKRRSRRYESANAFAQDVERYLAGEAVQACPPSARYRFKKFARRHRLPLAAGAVAVLAAAAAIIGLAVSNHLISEEKQQKEAALEEKETALEQRGVALKQEAGALRDAIREKNRADDNLAAARTAVKEFLLKTSNSPLLGAHDFQDLRKELLESALPFYRKFVRQAQRNPRLEAERARAYQDLANLRRQLGDVAGGLKDLAEAEKILQTLSRQFPDQPDHTHELAIALVNRGIFLDDKSHLDDARKAYQQAAAILEPLTAAYPRGEYLATSAQAANNLGTVDQKLGNAEDAEKNFRRGLDIRKKLLDANPNSDQCKRDLAQSLGNLGLLFRKLNRSDEAIQACEDALALLDADKPVESQVWQVSLASLLTRSMVLTNLAECQREKGRLRKAERALKEVLSVREAIVDRYPSVPRFQREQAGTLNNFGNLLVSLDRRERAKNAYEKSAAIYERLAARPSSDPDISIRLAGTYSNLARLVGDTGNLEASLPFSTKAIATLEAAYRKDSRVVKVRESLQIAHWVHATALCGLSRYKPALKNWGRAIELDDGKSQVLLRVKRASTLLNLEDHVRAAADAQVIAQSATAAAEDLYNAACIYAYCAKFAAGDEEAVESYGAQGVAVLRKALGKSYKKLANIKKHPDLNPLRERKDFIKLLQELDEKKPVLQDDPALRGPGL